MNKFLIGCALAALATSGAYAQSTGSIEVDSDSEIVVTGQTTRNGVGGMLIPDSTKAKAVLTQEFINKQAPGQSILNTINSIPGVNFTNNDPYGSSGGNLRIRGFDGNRVSLTFDGIPLNDTGNYAIYSNQQLDPELIDQVNVNLGSTDVDSPTASAAGGTVNYRTVNPTDEIGAILQYSRGDFDYNRVFGMFNTGTLTSFGTKAWVSASNQTYDKFKGPGGNHKQQYNFKIYQPIGSSGDFIAVAGNYNQNRNNQLRAVSQANYAAAGNALPGESFVEFARRFDNNATCARPMPGAGIQVDPANCSDFYGVRINPSNTGNVRINSRFTLAEGLILTIDPSYQYTLAHGGGSTLFSETAGQIRGTATGADLNGDGDLRDTVRLFTPNITNTHRYGVLSSLIWDVSPQHRLRLAYSYDRGNHRQTGEFGLLDLAGLPQNQFSGRNGTPVLDGNGNLLQQRDRKSIALLNQISGEYRGKYLDDRIVLTVGVRAPFFKRELDQNCYTIRSSGFGYCTSQAASSLSIVSPINPNGTYFVPFESTYKYSPILPNAGVSFEVADHQSLFASYTRGFSAPRTDNLYRANVIDVNPETTNSFDLGYRYTTSSLQAQLSGWYIKYANRIVTSFDQDLGFSIDRNVGKVDTYGVDANVAYRPISQLTVSAFGSYLHSKLKDDIQVGGTAAAPIVINTRGKVLSETPEWQFGGSATVNLGPLEIGADVKRVGRRFATDLNDVSVKGYTVVNLNSQFSLARFGLEKSYFQLNVINLFDEKYLGSINTQIAGPTVVGGGTPTYFAGAPRTVMGTVRFGF